MVNSSVVPTGKKGLLPRGGGSNHMSADDQGRGHAARMSFWLRSRRYSSTETGGKRDEAVIARRARLVERLALFIGIFYARSLFGLGMYALAVEARTRLGSLFVGPTQ